MTSSRRGAVLISVGGALAVVAYAVWGAVQITILTPLAAAPGLTLREIREEMATVGESPSDAAVVIFLTLGVVFAAVVALIVIRARVQAGVAAVLFLALLMLGGPALFVASFGPGMALADTFGVAGGVSAPGVAPLYAVSALAGVGCIVLGVALAVRSRPITVTI